MNVANLRRSGDQIENLRRDQVVVENDLGCAKYSDGFDGQQVWITRTRPHEIDLTLHDQCLHWMYPATGPSQPLFLPQHQPKDIGSHTKPLSLSRSAEGAKEQIHLIK